MPPVAIPPVLKLHDWVWSQKRASREATMGGGGVEHPRAGMIEEKECWDFALYQSEAWKRVPVSLRSRSPKTLGWNSPAHGLRLLVGPPHPSNRQIWAPFGQADGRWCPCISYFWRKDAVRAMRKVFLMTTTIMKLFLLTVPVTTHHVPEFFIWLVSSDSQGLLCGPNPLCSRAESSRAVEFYSTTLLWDLATNPALPWFLISLLLSLSAAAWDLLLESLLPTQSSLWLFVIQRFKDTYLTPLYHGHPWVMCYHNCRSLNFS